MAGLTAWVPEMQVEQDYEWTGVSKDLDLRTVIMEANG